MQVKDDEHLHGIVEELQSGVKLSACRTNYIKKVLDFQDTINYNW